MKGVSESSILWTKQINLSIYRSTWGKHPSKNTYVYTDIFIIELTLVDFTINDASQIGALSKRAYHYIENSGGF